LAWEQVEMGRRIGVPQPFAPTTFELRCSIEQAPKLPAFASATHRENGNVWRRPTLEEASRMCQSRNLRYFARASFDKQDLPVGILPQRE